MCLTPCSYLSSWIFEIATGPCPSCDSVADCVGERGAWLWKQTLFWLTCMVESAFVGMSVSLAEETAVKDPGGR